MKFTDSAMSGGFELGLVDFSAGGLYVDIRPTRYIHSQGKIIDDYSFNHLAKHFFNNVQIIAPRKNVREKLSENWLPYSEILIQRIKEFFKDKKNSEEYFINCGIKDNLSYDEIELFRLLSNCQLDKDHIVLSTARKAFSPDKIFLNQLKKVIDGWQIEITFPKNFDKSIFKLTMNKINGYYPLLKYIKRANIIDITNYIQMCDNQRKGTE